MDLDSLQASPHAGLEEGLQSAPSANRDSIPRNEQSGLVTRGKPR